jgi:hypothetical protein
MYALRWEKQDRVSPVPSSYGEKRELSCTSSYSPTGIRRIPEWLILSVKTMYTLCHSVPDLRFLLRKI